MTDVMTESLLDQENQTQAINTDDTTGDGDGSISGSSPATMRPDGLPDKFWDDELGEMRVDVLVKSYNELENRLGGAGLPEAPGDYEIAIPDGLGEPDQAVNERLHDAGFSQDQAQLVYDLAGEYIQPMVTEVAESYEAEAQIERLSRHFGGTEKWRESAAQIQRWGQAKLPGAVFKALSTTFEGVLALHEMMENREPVIGAGADQGGAGPSETQLRALMRNPRYWRDRDPVIVSEVRQGYSRLYQE